jgi:Protein of unknown function DUF262
MPTSNRRTTPAPIVAQHAEPGVEETVDDLDEALEVIPYTYSITAYGADYPVDGVVKRIEASDILVPTFSWEPDTDSRIVGFQREYVWPRTKADRFIESLLLGLPVPGIFLVKEHSGRLLVLDGHQRLYTLKAFYDGVIHGIEYRLENVQERFVGKRYKELDVEDRRRQSRRVLRGSDCDKYGRNREVYGARCEARARCGAEALARGVRARRRTHSAVPTRSKGHRFAASLKHYAVPARIKSENHMIRNIPFLLASMTCCRNWPEHRVL